ncbi:MAG: hypothetical protein ACI3ZV_03665, partial [Paludibacteraceae bacterium]
IDHADDHVVGTSLHHQAQRYEGLLIKPSKTRQLLGYLYGGDSMRIVLLHHAIAGVLFTNGHEAR